MSQAEPVNEEVPKDHGKFGKLQRLLLETPAPDVFMVLGEPWKKQDEAKGVQPFGYKGFSLKTGFSLFVDVVKKTLFQGHGPVVLQTDEKLTTYSTGQTCVHAKDATEVASARQVIVTSVTDDGHEPPVGAHMQELTGSEETGPPDVATFFDLRDKLLDRIVKVFQDWATHVTEYKEPKQKVGSKWAEANSKDQIKVLEDLATATKSDGKAVGVAVVSDKAIARMSEEHLLDHGKAGIWQVAGARDKVADFSAHASGNASVRAIANAELFGKVHTHVEGGASVEVVSPGPALVASREGQGAVLGKTVQIGARVQSPFASPHDREDVQKLTESVLVDGNEVAITAKDKIAATSEDVVEITGTNKCTIKVGDFTVVLDTAKITIGNANTPSTVKVESSKITIDVAGAASVTVQPTSIVAKMGGSSVEVGPAGVTVKGPQIKLG